MFSGDFSSSRKPLAITTKTVARKVAKPVTPTATSSSSPSLAPPKVVRLKKAAKPRRAASPPRPRKHVARKRSTPPQHFSSSDDEGVDDVPDISRKRVRRSETGEPDPERRVRALGSFDERGDHTSSMVHAADVPALDKSVRYKPSFEGLPDGTVINLQYPSASQTERFGHIHVFPFSVA
jgi:hypothetical protein